MGRLWKYVTSSIGKKQLMAVTGLGLSLFVLLHMAGNLIVLLGPDSYNAYGHAMVSNPLLYPAEAGLLTIFLLHTFSALSLSLENHRARPVKYYASPKGTRGGISAASKTMIYTGLLVFVFVVLHLKTFKFGTHYEVEGKGVRDLYRLIVEVFSDPGYVAWYVVALLVLGLHLSHGIASTFQSLGWNNSDIYPGYKCVGKVLAVVITAGFLAVPAYVWFFLRGAGL